MTDKEKSPYPKIDKIRNKFDNNEPLSLREVCFVLWAELMVCSTQYLMFAYWARSIQKLPKRQKFTWLIWKNLFHTFAQGDWQTLRNDLDLVVKVSKLGVELTK